MTGELALAKRFPLHKRHAMRLVKLPPGRVFGVTTSNSISADGSGTSTSGTDTLVAPTSADAKFIQDTLHETYGIEVLIKCVDAQLYVRISAHMYNSLDEYARLADVLQAARDDDQ